MIVDEQRGDMLELMCDNLSGDDGHMCNPHRLMIHHDENHQTRGNHRMSGGSNHGQVDDDDGEGGVDNDGINNDHMVISSVLDMGYDNDQALWMAADSYMSYSHGLDMDNNCG